MDITQDFFNAVKFGDAVNVKKYLDEQPALANRKIDGATPLHFAALNGHQDVIELLVDRGADLEARDDEFNATPISWANEKGNMSVVHNLSDRGALVSIDRAAAFGLVDLIREYIADGTENLNVVGGFGTPLHEAALWGYPEIVELLLQNGADPTIPNVDGRTPFAIASKQVESGGNGTPLVSDVRRREIIDGCSGVIGILRRHGILR